MTRNFRIALVALIAFVAISFSSCKDDPKGINMTYHIKITDDLAEVATVRVNYTDFEGTEKYVTLESTDWEITISSPLPPVTSKIRIETSRNGKELENKDYNIGFDYECITDLYDDGNIVESVRYTEFLHRISSTAEDVNKSLSYLNFERSYNAVSSSDGGIQVEEFRQSNAH